MVQILPPPPAKPPRPIFTTLDTGTHLVRIFDPSQFGATALSFRFHGPHTRFDHHRGVFSAGRLGPALDSQRGIYYAAKTLSGCIVEVFGDREEVVCGQCHVAMPRITRPLHLIDLRRSGAMRAGSVAALAKVADHSLAQAWSRWFYELPEYQACDGLLYYNAHNDEDAIALYERAATGLDCPSSRVMRLDAEALRPALLEIAEHNNLVCAP